MTQLEYNCAHRDFESRRRALRDGIGFALALVFTAGIVITAIRIMYP